MNVLRSILVAIVASASGLVIPAAVIAQDGDAAAHLNLLITSAEGDSCDTQYAWIDAADCADLTSAAIAGPARVWVVFSRVGGAFPGIGAVEFGIEYSANLTDWTTCTGGLEIPSVSWPDSGSSITVGWPGGCYSPPGESARVGYFTVGDGASGFVRIVASPARERAIYTTCMGREYTICEASLGAADLSEGTAPRCDVMPISFATSCAATDGPCPLTVSWQHDGVNAAGFRVLRNTVPLAVTSPLVRVYGDTSAVPGVAYWYSVVALSACGVAAPSDPDPGRIDPIEGPSRCDATTDRCDHVRVSWSEWRAVVLGFRVLRDGSPIAEVGPGVTVYHDLSAVPGRAYWYQIVPFDACGDGQPSAPDNGWIPPVAAYACAASDDLCGVVHVTWVDQSIDESGFIVMRDDAVLAEVAADIRQYDDFTATPGRSYVYTIVATGVCGPSIPSNPDVGRARGLAAASSCAASDDRCDLVHVSWIDESPDELGFDIVRDGVVVATTDPDIEGYDDATLVPGETHTYAVVAFNDCLRAEPSNDDSGTRAAVPPAPPQCLASDDLCGLVRVSWTPGEGGASGFIVFRDGEEIATAGPAVTHYDDITAGPGTTPSYAVTAFNGCGDSDLSASDLGGLGSSPPPPASDCTATDDLCALVRVSWVDESLDETGFRVLREGVEIAVAPSGATHHDDETGAPGQAYSYAVVATNDCGDAAASTADLGASASPAPPDMPTLVAPADGATCALNPIQLRWSRVPGALVYNLRIGTACGEVTLLNVITEDTTRVVSLTPGTTVFWSVVAQSSCEGWGEPSPCFSFEVGGGLSPPHLVEYEIVGEDLVRFRWSPVAGAERYLLSISRNQDSCYFYGPQTVIHTVAAPETTVHVSELLDVGFLAWIRSINCGDMAGPPSECLDYWPWWPVLLEHLDAAPAGASIVVKWRTSAEEDVAGFYLFRRDESGGAFARITPALIAAGTRRYEYEDRDVIGGRTYRYRLVEVGFDGAEIMLGETTATAAAVAGEVLLRAGHPNPFNPTTTLEIEVPVTSKVRLDVFDASGRWVLRLAEGTYGPGRHRVAWDGRDRRGTPAPSGTYFARLDAGGEVRVSRLVLVR